MKKNDSHEKHKRHAFDSFARKVLRNEARNIYAEERRREKYEVFFSELSKAKLEKLFGFDEYLSEQFYFNVTDTTVVVKSEMLAEAIAEDRNVVQRAGSVMPLGIFCIKRDTNITKAAARAIRMVSRNCHGYVRTS
jgi:hypothetical protein